MDGNEQLYSSQSRFLKMSGLGMGGGAASGQTNLVIIDFSIGGNSFLVLLLPNADRLKVLMSVNSGTVL